MFHKKMTLLIDDIKKFFETIQNSDRPNCF
jgi:hypothetical protein